MTTELIKISTDTAGRSAVSGRELHEFLGIESEYMHWFRRMTEYGFLENQDFEVIVKKDENPQGGRPSTDHAISLSMAKELCMIQRTDKGKEARLYFIECEKKLKDSANCAIVSGDYLIRIGQEMNRLNQQLVIAETKIAEDKPLVDFATTFKNSNIVCHVQGLANILFNNGIDTGRNRLINDLRASGDIMKHEPLLTQKARDRGIGQNVPTGSYEYRGVAHVSYRAFLNYKGIVEVFDRYNLTQAQRDAVLRDLTKDDEPLPVEVGGDFPPGYFDGIPEALDGLTICAKGGAA